MSTGGAFYDEQAMRDVQCGHCGREVSLVEAEPLEREGRPASERVPPVCIDVSEPTPFPSLTQRVTRTFYFYQCPRCRDVTAWMMWHPGAECGRQLSRVYPLPRSQHPTAPDAAPPAIARAYEDACRVLFISPVAAAALARRALQMILRNVVGVAPADLFKEIEAARNTLPAWIVAGLHDLRKVGNFALHPEKDALTGEMLEPEPGEAELTLDLVAALFQHLYAGRHAAEQLAKLAVKFASRRTPGGGGSSTS
jgi:hypothetical protein